MGVLVTVIVVVVVVVAVGVVLALVRASREKPPPIPEGWYPDLHDPSIERFHDGAAWTDQTRPNPEELDR